MIFKPIRISEHSLSPRFQDGDYVIISSLPVLLRGIRTGDVVVFRHPRMGELIKIVERTKDGGRSLYVVGLTADSIDSRDFGWVDHSTVLGIVIFHAAQKLS